MNFIVLQTYVSNTARGEIIMESEMDAAFCSVTISMTSIVDAKHIERIIWSSEAAAIFLNSYNYYIILSY